MKIYFSGSIRGGREYQEFYDVIVSELSKHGEVLSEFVADKSLTSYGSKDMNDEEIYNRDVKLVQESDIVIADISVPSLGVGYEIAYAEKLGKKVFCLYHKTEGKKVSAMIVGNKSFTILPYESKE